MKIMLGLNTLTSNINLIVDTLTHEARLNGETIDIATEDFARKILMVTSSWEEGEILEDSSILDGLSYFVEIENKGKTFKYAGKNKFPKNFNHFLYVLDEAGVC